MECNRHFERIPVCGDRRPNDSGDFGGDESVFEDLLAYHRGYAVWDAVLDFLLEQEEPFCHRLGVRAATVG